MIMMAAAGGTTDKVKEASSLYWLPGMEGTTPNSGFDARGAGYYDPGVGRYMNLLGYTNFWTSDGNSAGAMASSAVVNYFCQEPMTENSLKSLNFSIRCLRKR